MSPSAAAGGGGGTWTHPRTGKCKVYSDEDVIAHEKAKVIAESERAQIQVDKEMLGFMEADGKVSDKEDIIAAWAYMTRMVAAGMASVGAKLRKTLEEMKMHPEEARRRVDGPISELMDYILQGAPFADPAKEKIDEDDEPGDERPTAPAAADGSEPPGDHAEEHVAVADA